MSVEGQGHEQEGAAEDTEGEAETISILDPDMSTTGITIPSIGQETGCETVFHQSHSDFGVHKLIAKCLTSYHTIK